MLGVLMGLLFGLTLLVFDAAMAFSPDLGLAPEEVGAVKVIIGGFLVVALLQVIAGIGVLAHREWARIIGIIVAVLGTLVGTLLLIGVAVAPDSASLAVALAVLGGYALAMFGLIAGGAHFRRFY